MGHPGPPKRPDAEIDAILAEWRRGHEENIPVPEVAARCGMTPPRLCHLVRDARREGHPDAVKRTKGPRGMRLDTEIILSRWRRGCRNGLTTPEIAAECGITVKALRQAVYRARKAGHPDAVKHPLAAETGTGLRHVLDIRARASRARRLAREAQAAR